jgi:predicted esterase
VSPDFGFVHVYESPAHPAAPTLVLLHGTGGSERDLLPLGRALAPEAGLLSPRGQVLERGQARFFRRLAEGVFDLDDLRARAAEVAAFVRAASKHYRFDPSRLAAAGFSNGANMAAALLLLAPDLLGAAVLFRAMVPLVPQPPPAIPGTPVLLASGRTDPMVSLDEAERLAALLARAGAAVTHRWEPAGHELTGGDVEAAHAWLASLAIFGVPQASGNGGPR